MIVKVKLFATLRRYGPPDVKLGENFPVILDESSDINQLLNKLKIPKDQAKIIMINGNISKRQEMLKEEDEVAIFPPVGGGTGIHIENNHLSKSVEDATEINLN